MDGLTNEEIATLFAPRKRTRNALTRNTSKFILERTESGELVKSPYVTSMIARFEGKAGTMARSRKGRTRRNANGRRYFVPNFDQDVVAYKV